MAADRGDRESPETTLSQDVQALQAFVLQLRELLEAVVTDGRHVPARHLDDVREAWVHAAEDLTSLIQALNPNVTSSQAESLNSHGLTGAPLRMKLGGWRTRLFNFGRRMDRAWLRSVLRWGDTLLSSLVDAMTLGAAGKEFKESIENFLTDAEEDHLNGTGGRRRRR